MKVPTGLKKTAALVVLRCGKQFLLLKRSKMPNEGKYTPVGGKLEPYEDPYAAALREVEEETGLKLTELRYAGYIIETSPTSYNWQCNVYVADIPMQTPGYCDEGTLEWVAYAAIADLPTPATDYYVYKYIMEERPFAINAVFDEELNLLKMVEEIAGEHLRG